MAGTSYGTQYGWGTAIPPGLIEELQAEIASVTQENYRVEISSNVAAAPLVIPAGTVVVVPLPTNEPPPATHVDDFWSVINGVLFATGDLEGEYTFNYGVSFDDDSATPTVYTFNLVAGTNLANPGRVIQQSRVTNTQLAVLNEPNTSCRNAHFNIGANGTEFALLVSHNGGGSRTMVIHDLALTGHKIGESDQI